MADTKSLVRLGSTGSIGVQALEVAQGAGYRVAALAAGSRVEPFEEQIRRYRPAAVSYTHLDVYKRQHQVFSHLPRTAGRGAGQTIRGCGRGIPPGGGKLL